jgi:hypothetical protein
MAIAFPASPVDGQIYAPGGNAPNYVYRASSGVWQVSSPLLLPAQPIANIAALRANATALGACYLQARDLITAGGGGMFSYAASDTSSGDDGGTIVVDSSGHRWYRERAGELYSVRWFGARGDGLTDDTASIAAAIAACAANGGGTVFLPAGIYLISATLNITADDVKLIGAGHGGWHDTGAGRDAATTLYWTGAIGGTIVNIYPAGTRSLRGNAIIGLKLDPGAGCSYGATIWSTQGGSFDFVGSEFTLALLYLGCSAGLGEAADCQHNDITLSGRSLVKTGQLLIADGTATANVSFNRFARLKHNYSAGNSVLLKNADNNVFEAIQLYRPSGSGVGLLLGASASVGMNARANLFLDCSPGAGGVYAQGTEFAAVPSAHNHILYYDQENGSPPPSVGASATLFWSGNLVPFGFRSYSDAANALITIDAPGHIRQTGRTGNIAAGGSAGIGLPQPLASYTSLVQVTPAGGTPVPFSASCTTTALTIWNGGTAPTQFYWTVEGV